LAIKQLKQGGLLTLRDLRKSSPVELESCIRPAGFYRQKAHTIRNFIEWLDRACAGSLVTMFARPAPQARRQLLRIKGLGPETVDAILLYAGRHPFFVADAYTRRILARHGLVHPEAGYASAQQFLHQHLPADPALFNEYHALLVEVGKRYCRRQAPQCDACPLEEFLLPAQPAEIAHQVS
jgi:endonuclease III related protein